MRVALISIFIFIFSITSFSQIEKVIFETYYVSDANDATDTLGGGLPAGSKTYRVYIDLKPGCKLRKIYGDANHALKIKSDSIFFNNIDRGKSFGNEFSKSWYGDNTVALDTWLTLGQTSKNIGANAYFGILKTHDTDSSFVGGGYNDGGSAGIAGGLLVNNDVSAGIPIKIADGFTMDTATTSWASYGIKDIVTGNDSTIFGSIVKGNQFISNNAGLQNSGTVGVNADSNLVLVAQLTTNGDVSFELNVELEEPDGPQTKLVRYVADGSTLLTDEVLSPFLKYPPVCGCTDNRYIQYNPNYACLLLDSCKTLKVYGCTDPLACNYDPAANIFLPNFCCYPGNCQNRDISVVCPTLSVNENNSLAELKLFPNPAQDQLEVQITLNGRKKYKYEIFDSVGQLVMEKTSEASDVLHEQLNISLLATGLYDFRLTTEGNCVTKKFIKN